MSRILSALLALMLVVGAGELAKADVTGSFDLDILMIPEGRQTESVKFVFDMQSNLQINVTLSGLTGSADLGFGVTGVEFAVLGVNTMLGALQVNDEFVFAAPFACTLFPAGISNSNGGFFGQCPGDQAIAIGDADGDGVSDNAVGFVKKRIQLELNIAGLVLGNLALFEDVDFPDIQGLNPATGADDHEHDHFDGSIAYDLSGVNNVVDDQTPTFGFGDVITLEGQTVSGITVRSETALCASNRNYIKKRSWSYEVNKACTAQFGQAGGVVLEDGAKTPLLFEQEILEISGVEAGGISMDLAVTFVPLQPVFAVLSASFTLLDLADVSLSLTSDNIASMSVGTIRVRAVSGGISITALDFDGNLDFDRIDLSLATVINANQNPATLFVLARTQGGTGLTLLLANLGISRGAFSFSSNTIFAGGGGDLSWVTTDFAVSVDAGEISISADVDYTPSGMGAMSLSLGMTF